MKIYNAIPNRYLDETLSKTIEQFVDTKLNSDNYKYVGRQVFQTEMGNMPVQFLIDASSIEEAFDKYDDALNAEMQRLEDLQKEENNLYWQGSQLKE